MRKNFGAKPYLYPQPVLIIATYHVDGTANAMNAAWGCISDQNEITLYLSAGHKTMENIFRQKDFTVSMADADHVVEADYLGIVSANAVHSKVEKAGLHTFQSEHVHAPLIEEFPLALECRMKSYDHDTERLIGEIVNVSADERILNENGTIDPAKLNPISFDAANHAYLGTGGKVGNAFQDGRKLKNSNQ